MRTWRNRLWYLGIQGISLLGLSVYIYTHTERQAVVSGYLGYQPAILSIHIYTHIQRNRLWYLGIWGTSLLGLSVYLYTRTQRNRLWYLGIQGISLLSSPYISINAYRETGCGILVSRVSVCWVFLYTSIHTYRETSSGIWVSRVSACCPLHTYLYTHTEKQVLVSEYLGCQPAGSFCVSIYTHTEKQVVVSGYPGYQPAVLSIYIYKCIQRNRLWYLGIQGISLLGLSVYIYTHIQRDKQWYQGIQGISLLSSLHLSLHTYRETGHGIWVSRVSVCCPLRIYL